METNFFKSLAAMGVRDNWVITVKCLEGDKLAVSVLLCRDKESNRAAKLIQPIVLTGSPADVDTGFFEHITTPVQKTSALFTNMESHKKSLEEAAKKIRTGLSSQKSVAGTADPQKEKEKAEAYSAEMETVQELEKQMKYNEALEALPNAAEYPKKEAEIVKKRKDLEAKVKLGATLF